MRGIQNLVLYNLLWSTLLCLMSTSLAAEQSRWDMREQDTVSVEFVEVAGPPWPDSVGLPVYIWADDTLGGFSLSFRSSDERLQVSSFSTEGSIFDLPGGVWTGPVLDLAENSIGFGFFNSQANWQTNPQGLIATIYFQIDPALPPGTEIDIDSTFIAPALYFELTTVVNSFAHAVRPAPFANRGGANIIFPEFQYVCGDADGSGTVNITDAVFLITFIFAGGPAPGPYLAGDANCDQTVNVTDAVYIINYIFGGGPAPCANCP